MAISKLVKRISASILLGAMLLTATGSFADAAVSVRGYYRKDGTYVRPHFRSNPDSSPYNNWSYPGNTNPYTGVTTAGDPDTYIRNLYDRSSSPRTSSYTPPAPAKSTGSVLGSTIASDFSHFEVPQIVATEFNAIYKRPPNAAESIYWKYRARSDKRTYSALRSTMGHWHSLGISLPTTQATSTGTVLGTTSNTDTIANANVPAVVEREFTSIFGRRPTPAESTYWKGRARTDKKTVAALRGAMLFQKAHSLTMPPVTVAVAVSK